MGLDPKLPPQPQKLGPHSAAGLPTTHLQAVQPVSHMREALPGGDVIHEHHPLCLAKQLPREAVVPARGVCVRPPPSRARGPPPQLSYPRGGLWSLPTPTPLMQPGAAGSPPWEPGYLQGRFQKSLLDGRPAVWKAGRGGPTSPPPRAVQSGGPSFLTTLHLSSQGLVVPQVVTGQTLSPRSWATLSSHAPSAAAGPGPPGWDRVGLPLLSRCVPQLQREVSAVQQQAFDPEVHSWGAQRTQPAQLAPDVSGGRPLPTPAGEGWAPRCSPEAPTTEPYAPEEPSSGGERTRGSRCVSRVS